MGALRFPIIAGRSVTETFAETPENFRSYLRRGFSVLARLSGRQVDEVLKVVTLGIQAGGPATEGLVASSIGLRPEEAKELLAAGSFLAVAAASSEEAAEIIINAAVEAKIILQNDREPALTFTSLVVRNRAVLRQALERGSAAREVLPSLDELETTVEIRPIFGKGHVESAVPVVLVHIDTDAWGQEIWFQASKVQLETMIKSLQEALRRLGETEKWMERASLPQR